jgi:hypothetical protein
VALLVAGMVALAVPATVGAQGPGEGELATVFVYSGSVELHPLRGYRQAVVKVGGGDYQRRLVFEPGDRIEIGTTDAEGAQLGDGVYGWELELLPDKATAHNLRIEASLNGGLAPEAWPKQSGSFRITGGLVDTPDLPETSGGPEYFESDLESSFQSSSSFGRAEAPLDDDAAVGSLEGVEAEVQAAAARQQPPAMVGLGRDDFERSDAAAQALGQSPEQLLRDQLQQLKRQPAKAAPERRTTSSDGADGRPRPDEDQ